MLRKLRTDSGALSGNSSISITPASLSIVTHCAAIVFTSAFSNGSDFVSAAGVGRGLAFGGTGCCEKAKERDPQIVTQAVSRFLSISDNYFLAEDRLCKARSSKEEQYCFCECCS